MRLFAAASLLALVSCAEPVVMPYDPATYTDGIRFNRPVQYLKVDPGGATSIVQLPNPDQEYVLKARGWIGNVDLKPVLTDGWNLTGIDVSSDKTAPVASLLTAAAGAGHSMLMGGALRAEPATPLAPGLYRIYLKPPRLVGPLVVANQ